MQGFLIEYWWAVGTIVLPALIYVVRQMAKTKAKTIALKYLAAAEKLVFETADAKIAFATQAAYTILPKQVKMFVPYAFFNIMVMSLYDEIKDLVEENTQKEGQ